MADRQSIRNLSDEDLLQLLQDTLSQAQSALSADGWQAEHQGLYDLTSIVNEADRRAVWLPPANIEESE